MTYTAARGATQRDWRVICDCQRHALHEKSLWQRAARAAAWTRQTLRRRGVALLIGVPLAFGTAGIPTEAMDTKAPNLSPASIARAGRSLPIFTTEKTRAGFLDPRPQRLITLDAMKEEFFRTQIPYGPIIYREAKKNNLPPELVAAVVAAESDFRPRLVSHRNAQGLMQIVPETAETLGAGNLFDPAENVAAGTRYLRYLLDRFPDQRLALAAYNAGEGNVEKFGGVPPFPETRDYLQRVAQRTHRYRQRILGTYAASQRLHSDYAD
jgi:soluble lytic murein transglycosylase-like protein